MQSKQMIKIKVCREFFFLYSLQLLVWLLSKPVLCFSFFIFTLLYFLLSFYIWDFISNIVFFWFFFFVFFFVFIFFFLFWLLFLYFVFIFFFIFLRSNKIKKCLFKITITWNCIYYYSLIWCYQFNYFRNIIWWKCYS